MTIKKKTTIGAIILYGQLYGSSGLHHQHNFMAERRLNMKKKSHYHFVSKRLDAGILKDPHTAAWHCWDAAAGKDGVPCITAQHMGGRRMDDESLETW